MEVENPNSANAPPSAFPMAKGDGEDSYSKNSQFQAFMSKVPTAALDEALEKVTLPSGTDPVRVADMGSSSGPNTIATVAHIVDKLRHRLPESVEFQGYFNDTPSNDFNNLFQLLTNDSRAKTFYAAGAPGSFYGRIFPRSSIHAFHSASAVHWLSKIPDGILDKKSPAYNGSQPWYQHSKSAVAKSYQQQALLDLQNFFTARAAEMVSGGLLFLLMSGRETSKPEEIEDGLSYSTQADFDEILSGLVAEELVTEERYSTFNIPTYHRSSQDIMEALKCCCSAFTVEVMKVHKIDFKEAFAGVDATALPSKLTGFFKGVANPLIEGHFGMNVAQVFWQRHEKLMEKKAGTRPEFLTIWIIGLIRN
ncbi:unnamed protein product [Calypogeia fissa]